MNPVYAFFLGALASVGLTVAALAFVRGPFEALLVELCGTKRRAKFWQNLYEVSLVVTVLFCAMAFPPSGGHDVGFFDVVAMFRAGTFGLLASLFVLTVLLLRSIRAAERRGICTDPLPRDESGQVTLGPLPWTKEGEGE